ncbi:MAG TPA: cell division protein ZapA [Croceibacterium sp.]|nr:cell division protein ZapA [Croceibacterium sp.]
MSNVTLTIGGKHYTVACAEGEEAHIEMLGRTIDGKLTDMPSLAGQSDARTLLFAALLLADELHEGRGGAALAGDELDTAVALESLAQRLEMLAARLESAA